MSKPRIALDIDDVLTSTTSQIIAFHNERFGTALTLDAVHSYHFHKVWGGSPDEVNGKLEQFYQTPWFLEIVPNPEAVLGVAELKKDYELVAVTSRPSHLLEGLTRAWLNQFFPALFVDVQFSNIYYPVGPFATKQALCQKLGAQLLIDDALDHVLECAAHQFPTILFGNYAWNQHAHLPPTVQRVEGWTDVLPAVHDQLSKI